LIDAAQAVPHMAVDVQAWDCDFMAFSGHKMCGPTGIGILYGKRELLEAMPPYMGGGDMIRRVTLEGSTWNDLPWKFEAGTPSIAEGIGLGAAVDYLSHLGMDNIHAHEQFMTHYALEALSEIPDLKLWGPPASPKSGRGHLYHGQGPPPRHRRNSRQGRHCHPRRPSLRHAPAPEAGAERHRPRQLLPAHHD
jgi:cysteine desulfurase / selenocysteine lyase